MTFTFIFVWRSNTQKIRRKNSDYLAMAISTTLMVAWPLSHSSQLHVDRDLILSRRELLWTVSNQYVKSEPRVTVTVYI
jgi:hypothetical protein